jgi:hypothetical protein
VREHDRTVATQLQIELDDVDAGGRTCLDRGEAVLRCERRCASVTDAHDAR